MALSNGHAFGILRDDNEWHHEIQETSQWATVTQMHKLFATLLLFCEISDPLKLWESHSEFLCEDILFRKRNLFNHPNLILTQKQIHNYCFEIGRENQLKILKAYLSLTLKTLST